jgi:hypothetical protein
VAILGADNVLGDEGAIAITMAGFVLLPIAIGVAVLRYRLFEIDRLLSRTVTYAAVVAMLVGVYATGVLVLGGLFQRESDLSVAVSTLAVAALFLPLRRRVRRVVDRRFNRSRYDAERELDRFAGRLREGQRAAASDNDGVRSALTHVLICGAHRGHARTSLSAPRPLPGARHRTLNQHHCRIRWHDVRLLLNGTVRSRGRRRQARRGV